jgi:multidrug resistance protein, MATE family
MNAYRESWRLAWPLILSNLSVPLLGMVDTGVVGHLPGPHFLGAVALGATTISVVYFAFGFLRMGTTAIAAQAYGAGHGLELQAALVRGMIVALAIGGMLALMAPLVVLVSHYIFAPTAEIEPHFKAYLAIRLLSAPAALGTLVIWGWMLGLQNARGPFIVMVVTNTLNAGLDFLFVFGFGFEVAGVALATVVAEYAGLALGLVLIRRDWRRLGGGLPARREILRRDRLTRLFRVNRDIFLRSVLLESSAMIFTALGSRQGELILAANAVLHGFFLLAAYGLDGFAFAAEAMVGKAVGARDPSALRRAIRAGFVNAGILSLVMTAAFVLGGPLIVRLLTDLEPVRQTAFIYLPWACLIPVVSIWAFLFDGIFFGATRTAELRNAMAIALALFLALAFTLTPAFGNHGLWAALLVFLGARGLLLGWVYRRRGQAAAFARAGS